MNSLVVVSTLALLASAVLGAQKPIKFPKKFDPKKHGPKTNPNSYSGFSSEPELPLLVPLGSTYENYNGFPEYPIEAPQLRREPFVEPITIEDAQGTYVVYAKSPSQPILPPPLDSYASADLEKVDIIVPPSEIEKVPEDSSYLSYQKGPVDILVPPPVSSYYEVKDTAEGIDLHESLTKLAQMLQARLSYINYEPAESSTDALVPPPEKSSPVEPSSYTEAKTENKELTAEQVSSLKEANIPIPHEKLVMTE